MERSVLPPSLRTRSATVSVGRLLRDSDLIFLFADSATKLARLKTARNSMRLNGGVWVVWPKGGRKLDEDGVRRAWSEPEPLWPRAPGQEGPSKSDPDEEPEFWNISQSGAMDALAHLRARKDRLYEIPADVSKDFHDHFKPWSVEEYRIPATNELGLRWKKSSDKADDHEFMCCCYLALWAEMAGATSADDVQPDEKDTDA